MPKYYCDYCDIFLTHDSSSVRKAHNAGRNHLINVRTYYNELSQQTTQEVINTITKAYAEAGAAIPPKYSGYPQPQQYPAPAGRYNPYGAPVGFPGMPPGMPGMPPLRLGLDGPNGLPPRPPPPMYLRPGAGPPPPGVPGVLPPGIGAPGTGGAPFPPPGFPPGVPFPPPGMPPFVAPPGAAPGAPGAAPFPPGQFPPPHFGVPGSIPPPSSAAAAAGAGPLMNSDRKRRLEEGRD
ncbi:hypothetical protein BGW39_006035 [Mortierella sp. 14UC]|nr:hypothetical protein BGW39_006035 [Mortierella sp. 14UC]